MREIMIFDRKREGEKFLIYTGPEGKPGGESRFPLSFKNDGVLKYKVTQKKYTSLKGCWRARGPPHAPHMCDLRGSRTG